MNRRKFLALTGVETLLGLGNFMASGTCIAMHDSQVVDVNVDAATLVGLWYLTEYPEEADRSTLLASLSDCAPEGCQSIRFSPKRIDSDYVRQASMMDYSCGDVVFAGGWQLARTEARVCALIALG